MTDVAQVFGAVGRGIAKAGVFVGRKLADGYHSIDPDVIRHISQVPLLSYSLLVSKNEHIDPGESDGYPPLIFVHGLGGNRGNFLLMSWYLSMLGRKRSYKIHFASGQSMEQMAEALAKFIRNVQRATGESQVDIVAHSMGGVLVRLAMVDHDVTDAIHTLLTLGTPHHGTYPARYANTDLTRNLRPDSEIVKKINALPWPKNVRGITMWSKNDVFVLPPESAKVEGTEQIEMTPFTHYSYLIDPKAWSQVGRMLMAEQIPAN